MIFTTSEVLQRLELMPDKDLLSVVNAAWEPFEGNEERWPSKVAPDRATFAALLAALTDDWPHRRDVDTPEHIREANSR